MAARASAHQPVRTGILRRASKRAHIAAPPQSSATLTSAPPNTASSSTPTPAPTSCTPASTRVSPQSNGRPTRSRSRLVTGTVEARKNLLVLIDALPDIPRLRIISAGPHTAYADEVRRRAAQRGVADRVELRGYVPRTELDELYARATCALIPSRYEGFGYALAEALCCAVPAVAARSSSLIEVADGAVTLVDPDDTTGWVDTVRALLNARESAESHAQTLRSKYVARFAWSSAAATTLAVYQRITR